MAILTQLLLLAVVGTAFYCSYVYNKAKYDKLFAMLPDLRAHSGGEGHSHASEHSEHPAPALSASVKVVVYVPDAHADAVRQAIGEAGGGVIGNYSFCTFSSLGTGRYLPGTGAHPMVGTVGVHERVEEERIEFTCSRHNLKKVVEIIKTVHPYEEIVIDIYPLEALPAAKDVHSH
jgi:hypothetical protein